MNSIHWFNQDIDDALKTFATKDQRKYFLEAVKSTKNFIKKNPLAGSGVYGDALGVAGLRHKSLLGAHNDYLFFYVIKPNGAIKAARLLHAKGSIAQKLSVLVER